MDINDARGIATVCSLVAFIGVIWWAFSARRKGRFEEDANLPFADDHQDNPTESSSAHNANNFGDERK